MSVLVRTRQLDRYRADGRFRRDLAVRHGIGEGRQSTLLRHCRRRAKILISCIMAMSQFDPHLPFAIAFEIGSIGWKSDIPTRPLRGLSDRFGKAGTATPGPRKRSNSGSKALMDTRTLKVPLHEPQKPRRFGRKD